MPMTTMTAAVAAATLAIVAQDQAPLRAAAKDSSAQQAVLWQGDTLEIRGSKGDFLQVYDHRRERAGYIRASQVRPQTLKPESAPELLAVVRFLRDTVGSESLGIAYAAAFLKAAPAAAIDDEVFDALGAMSERLARRAAANRGGNKATETLAAHLEVAQTYGVNITSFETEGQMQLCYDGEAYRTVLALAGKAVRMAEATLALTRHDCLPPTLGPVERYQTDTWRAELLDRVPMTDLPATLKNRLHMRKAGVWASLAHQRARRPNEAAPVSGQASNEKQADKVSADKVLLQNSDWATVQQAGKRAVEELAAVDKNELMESDQAAYQEAAVRVGASRWATHAGLPAPLPPGKLSVVTSAGQPGETCVHLVDGQHDAAKPLLTRCTYGVVWPASAVVNSQGTILTLAVQPLDTWREMWVFQRDAADSSAGSGKHGWQVVVVPPAEANPGQGYIEFSGWVPGQAQVLTTREAKVEGRFATQFELRRLDTLAVEKHADKPANLSAFYRWQSPAWKSMTISLR